MADPRRLPFKILIALLKHQVKRFAGEEAVGIVAEELIDAGGEGALAQVDKWLQEPKTQKEIDRALAQASELLKKSRLDDELRQTFLTLSSDEGLRKAISQLPNAADDDGLYDALQKAVLRRVRISASSPRLDRALRLYLDCLRRGLLTLKDAAPSVVGQAVLRIEKDLTPIREGVENVDRTTRRTEEKLDTFITTWQQHAAAAVRANFIDFTDYIRDKTGGFVGRRFVFEALDEFLHKNVSGYFVVRGDPGIGKTAIMARLVTLHQFPHHFNSVREGFTTLQQFTLNAIAQIVARHGLPSNLAMISGDEANALRTVLSSAAKVSKKPVILVVDALDETSPIVEAGPRPNPLRLPNSLPDRVFIIASTRRTDKTVEIVAETVQVLELKADSELNKRDVIEHIANFVNRPSVTERLAALKWDKSAFSEKLQERSEFNFMYLHYVLPAFEKGELKLASADELPAGLQGYYQRHWDKMRGDNLAEFMRVNQKVVAILATARQPVSKDFIARVSNLTTAEVQWTLDKWWEFLHVSPKPEPRYSLYHASYRDFLAEQAG